MGLARSGLKGSCLRFLTEAEIQSVHRSSAELLADVGMEINDREILEILRRAGCRVDFASRVVRVPPELLDSTIRGLPHAVRLCARQPEDDLQPGDGALYVRTTGGPPFIADLDTGSRREATLRDLALSCRVADALEHIHGVSVFQVVPMDVPRPLLDVYAAEASFLNTRKHLFYYTQNPKLIDHVLEMAVIVAGGEEPLRRRPLVSGFCEVRSPLTLDSGQARLLCSFLKRGLPVYTHSHPIAGITAPVTLAGELALMNAETLMVILIAQLLAPGAGLLYGTSASVPDMRTALNLSGAVEIGLLGGALAQMAQFYGLPSTMTSGTDSKVLDGQAFTERLFTALPPILAGIDLLNLSTTDTKMTYSLPLLAADNELMRWVARVLRGITVDEKTLAVGLTKEVARKSPFISEPHTVQYMRQELLGSAFAIRQPWDAWKEAGSPLFWQNARAHAIQLARDHQPPPISEEVRRGLADIVQSAKRCADDGR
jgi:trimethylamine--corrinoid protein Co-methyltransferase